ncbi:MAG TPA: hypothetical protein VFD36_31170 [Kofleriaceae bacterium]|nr:hypothetical protein [Kofleriaceae bacterium]
MSVARAAVAAASRLPEEQRLLYSALIESALSEAARKALTMEAHVKRFFSDAQREAYYRAKAEGQAEGEAKGKAEGEAKGKAEGEAKGKAEGEARGQAKALLVILKGRGLALTDEQRLHILACPDLAVLDRWLDRALLVTSVDELLA